jgi:hypothetical protein
MQYGFQIGRIRGSGRRDEARAMWIERADQ